MNLQLLKNLCGVFAPSGEEGLMTEFLLTYIEENKKNWKVQPQIFAGGDFRDSVVLVFGKPRTVVFSHIDSIGFMVRYGKELIKVGGPLTKTGYPLKGRDSQGEISCTLKASKSKKDGTKLEYVFDREIDRGTNLVFDSEFRETKNFVTSCYLDDRLGCWNTLRLAETLEDGIIAFSCGEEVGGSTMPQLVKFCYEEYQVKQAIISDITWITEGVLHAKGAAISIRDKSIPRRKFINHIIELAKESEIPFQIEVESSGGSDGKEIQHSPYPIDWAFIGCPQKNTHTPNEKAHKKDLQYMLELYQFLMKKM